jgi:hypothetical protein
MTKVSKDVYQKVLDELYAEGVFMKEILPSFKDIDFSTSAVKNILESSNDLFYDVT